MPRKLSRLEKYARLRGYPMAERVVLQQPGTELILTVKSVTPEIIDKNEYFLFGNGSKELLVPQSSIKGRYDRLGVTSAEQLVGKTVRFARSTKISRAGKPYWDVDLSSGAEASGTPAAAAPTGVSTGSVSQPVGAESAKPKMRDAYKSITEWVLKEVGPVYDEYFNTEAFTPEIAAACVQTLFIQACHAGKVE